VGCNECPGQWAKKTMVNASGNDNAEIIIVAEAPGASEVGAGKNFVGRSGKYLAGKLKDIGIDVNKVMLVNACKCFISDPSVEVLKHCHEYLVESVNACSKRRIILALGAKALKALVPKESKGILANSGKTFWSEEFGCKILACLHPAAVLRNARLDALFKESLARINKVEFVHKPFDTIRVESVEELQSMFPPGTALAVDLETTGLDYLAEEFRVTDIGFFDGEKAAICGGDIVGDSLIEFLNNAHCIYHNGSYDIKCLYRFTGKWPRISDDTMLMGYVQNESFGSSEDTGYGLERLSMLYLNAEPWKTAMKAKHFAASEAEMDRYLSLDVYHTWNLWNIWKDIMPKQFYKELLIPAVNAKSKMEYFGVHQDTDLVTEINKFAKKRIVSYIKSLRKLINQPNYNPNSGPQNLKIFKKLLGNKITSTDKDVVNANLDKPFFRTLLRYRKLSKQISTFLTNKHVANDGNVHTNFRIHGTETGRISSSQPNIQNIPKYCRKIYIPDEGHEFWVDVDYDQLEMKLILVLAGLNDVLEQVKKGYDLHTITSMLMTGKNPSDILKHERTKAKHVNFGCIYGAGDEKIATLLSTDQHTCSLEEARAFKAKYFFTRPDLEQWKANLIKKAMRDRYVETEFGGRRRFGLITRDNYAEVCRLIVNTKVQGTAGQMCLSRVTELVDVLPAQFDGARIINTVHDQICASSPGGREVEVAEFIKQTMERPFHFSDFVFTASAEINRRWK
jgi:uracil-DNA glycosylase family 4